MDVVTSAAAAGYDVVRHTVMIPLELSRPRVASRTAAGGHDVPAAKLAARYERLCPLIVEAVPHCYWAVLWDNADATVRSRSAPYGSASPTTRLVGRGGPRSRYVSYDGKAAARRHGPYVDANASIFVFCARRCLCCGPKVRVVVPGDNPRTPTLFTSDRRRLHPSRSDVDAYVYND